MLLAMISGRCYTTKADVIAYIYVFYTVADVIIIVVADVITTLYLIYIWLMLLPCVCGRCYYH